MALHLKFAKDFSNFDFEPWLSIQLVFQVWCYCCWKQAIDEEKLADRQRMKSEILNRDIKTEPRLTCYHDKPQHQQQIERLSLNVNWPPPKVNTTKPSLASLRSINPQPQNFRETSEPIIKCSLTSLTSTVNGHEQYNPADLLRQRRSLLRSQITMASQHLQANSPTNNRLIRGRQNTQIYAKPSLKGEANVVTKFNELLKRKELKKRSLLSAVVSSTSIGGIPNSRISTEPRRRNKRILHNLSATSGNTFMSQSNELFNRKNQEMDSLSTPVTSSSSIVDVPSTTLSKYSRRKRKRNTRTSYIGNGTKVTTQSSELLNMRGLEKHSLHSPVISSPSIKSIPSGTKSTTPRRIKRKKDIKKYDLPTLNQGRMLENSDISAVVKLL